MRFISVIALTSLLAVQNLGFAAEGTSTLDATLNQAKASATKAKDNLTDLAKKALDSGKTKVEAAKVEGQKALSAGKAKVETAKAEGQKALDAGIQKTNDLAIDIKAAAADVVKKGEDKLQLLLDLGDEKSLKEAKDYVLSKLKGHEQVDAVADLMKRGVKGFGPWFQNLKLKAGSTAKMKMAYYSRYVNDPAIANKLKKWMNEDQDPLVQEYSARALGYQTSDGVLDALKSKLAGTDVSDHVKSALESSIALLEPPKVEAEVATPALPALPAPAK